MLTRLLGSETPRAPLAGLDPLEQTPHFLPSTHYREANKFILSASITQQAQLCLSKNL